MMNDIIEQMQKRILIKRDEYVKQEFKKQHIDDLFNSGKRFPGYVVEQHGEWLNYWADNGTDSGIFICAVSQPFMPKRKYNMREDIQTISLRFNHANNPVTGSAENPEFIVTPSPTNKQQ